jgi:hypothetical protein
MNALDTSWELTQPFVLGWSVCPDAPDLDQGLVLGTDSLTPAEQGSGFLWLLPK